ncbi:unnamed protein product [Amoebophrya sp. A25]|nr:unnamed protein product [Amoebophrya sp. A25]|eukprot:GSA25T00016783001.1
MYRSAVSRYTVKVDGESEDNSLQLQPGAGAAGEDAPPFDVDAANEVLRLFLSRYPKILTQGGDDPDYEAAKKSKKKTGSSTSFNPEDHKKPHLAPYYPLTSCNTTYEDAGTCNGLLMQVEMHAQVATVLAAFVFAALIAESPSQLFEGSPTPQQKSELFRVSEMTMNILDQIRVFFLASILLSLVVLLLCMLCLQEYLTTRAGKKYFRVWSPTLNNQCIWMVNTLMAFLLTVPLYVLKYFGFSVIFFLIAPMPLYWIKQLFTILTAYTDLAILLNHIELGVKVDLQTTSSRGTLRNPFFDFHVIFVAPRRCTPGTSKRGSINLLEEIPRTTKYSFLRLISSVLIREDPNIIKSLKV